MHIEHLVIRWELKCINRLRKSGEISLCFVGRHKMTKGGRGYNQCFIGKYDMPSVHFCMFRVVNCMDAELIVSVIASGDPAGARGKPGSGYGYGAGIRVDSPLGPLRLEYAFNDKHAMRFHFGVGPRN